jgi:hypothetical protein
VSIRTSQRKCGHPASVDECRQYSRFLFKRRRASRVSRALAKRAGTLMCCYAGNSVDPLPVGSQRLQLIRLFVLFRWRVNVAINFVCLFVLVCSFACSDPGTSKSQLLSYVHKLAPRGIYTSGRGSRHVACLVSLSQPPSSSSSSSVRWV